MIKTAEIEQAEAYLKLFNAKQLTDQVTLIKALNLKWFRLNALYKIKDKEGRIVRFRPNYAQKQRYSVKHTRHIILKARQLGFTTFEMIDALDDCLFTENFGAGCIAHTMDDAKDIFRNKIKFAYDDLVQSAWMQVFNQIGFRFPTPKSDKNEGYVFDNGSSIRVGVSYRGGTLQRLHVSEFGKICRKYPDKAQEIVTGAFEAVAKDGQLTIESTAEGAEGYYYEYCEKAKNLQLEKRALTTLDFHFHFFPWWGNEDYALDPAAVTLSASLQEYFDKMQIEIGRKLSPAQKAWYAKKQESLGEDMLREYPSTPKEAFAQSIEGAYYARQMAQIRQRGQIMSVPYDERLPVYAFFDLGRNDSTSIWFMQTLHGREYRFIRYYENSGESIQFYCRKLHEFGYLYNTIYLPHDAEITDLSSGDNRSRRQIVEDAGFRVEVVPRVPDKLEAIQAVRDVLPLCWFDENNTTDGVKCLDHYRKEWDDKMGNFKDRPRHDWASHGNDAFEQFARGFFFDNSGMGSYEPDCEV